jgi:hypothetical protein
LAVSLMAAVKFISASRLASKGYVKMISLVRLTLLFFIFRLCH